MGLIDQLEWIGSLSGLVGAFLLATHTRGSRYGWLAFLAANLALSLIHISEPTRPY